MARFIVRTDSVAAVFDHWRKILSSHCGQSREWVDANNVVHIEWDRPYVPEGEDPKYVFFRDANRERGNPVFCFKRGLFDSLRDKKLSRICWFYYCDDALGNTIRLYDNEHFEFGSNRSIYLELEGNGRFLGEIQSYPDRVLIRGENIGLERNPLKRELRGSFAERHGARTAPLVWHEGRVDLEGMCENFFAKRHAYFQQQGRNSMPGNALRVVCKDSCTRDPCSPTGSVSPHSEVMKSTVIREPSCNSSSDQTPASQEDEPTPVPSPEVEGVIQMEVSMSSLEARGYSERGMINAMCYEMKYSAKGVQLLRDFLKLRTFPCSSPDFDNFQSATFIIEQSFSDFGDLDLLILLDGARKQAVLLEAKVKTYQSNYWNIHAEWAAFKQVPQDTVPTANLFIQLYRKMRLVRKLRNSGENLERDAILPRQERSSQTGNHGTTPPYGRGSPPCGRGPAPGKDTERES